MTQTIRGTTAVGVGPTYIPVNRYPQELTIQVIANTSPTFTVDYTGDDIFWSTAALAAANLQPNRSAQVGDPANAMWTNLIASGSANAAATTEARCAAIRINITVGASASVTYTINQGGAGE